MSHNLIELRKEKFGKELDLDSDFNGPSDPSDAPEEFHLTLGPKSFYITPETAAESQPYVSHTPCYYFL